MVLKSLFILLLCAIFVSNISFQNAVKRSSALVNVTTGYVEETITLRCEVPDAKLEDEKLEVYFHTNFTSEDNNLAVYSVSSIYFYFKTFLFFIKKFIYVFILDLHNFNPHLIISSLEIVKTYISSISSLPSTLTKYEISIVPKIAFKADFSCKTYYQGQGTPTVSNKALLVVSNPRPTFTGDNIVGASTIHSMSLVQLLTSKNCTAQNIQSSSTVY